MKNKLTIAVIDPLIGNTYAGIKNTLQFVASHLTDDDATLKKETRMSFEMLSHDEETTYEYVAIHNENFDDGRNRGKVFDQVLVANYFEMSGPVSDNYYETKLLSMGPLYGKDKDIFTYLLGMSCVPSEYKIIHMKEGYESGSFKAFLLNTMILR